MKNFRENYGGIYREEGRESEGKRKRDRESDSGKEAGRKKGKVRVIGREKRRKREKRIIESRAGK